MAVKSFKATPMKAGDIHGYSKRPDESCGMAYEAPVVPSTIATKTNAKPSMIDGPYGGKKPVS